MIIIRENPARLLRETMLGGYVQTPARTSAVPHLASTAREDHDTPPALLSMKLIRQFYLPVDERTLDRWLSSGKFPQADIKQGAKVRFWKRETVEAWIAESCAASGQ